MEDEIWTTKDGRKIPVGEMTESHVRNTLRMILKNRRERDIPKYEDWEEDFWQQETQLN